MPFGSSWLANLHIHNFTHSTTCTVCWPVQVSLTLICCDCPGWTEMKRGEGNRRLVSRYWDSKILPIMGYIYLRSQCISIHPPSSVLCKNLKSTWSRQFLNWLHQTLNLITSQNESYFQVTSAHGLSGQTLPDSKLNLANNHRIG